MRQPPKPGFKKWLLIGLASLGIGTGGVMTGGGLPNFTATAPDTNSDTASYTETIPANSPDIIWVTPQKPLSVDFNNITAKGQQDMLNFNLQSAASMGNFNTVENLLNQGADAKADDSAALKMAMTGAKSATDGTVAPAQFEKIIKLLQDRGASAGDQQSLADRSSNLSGQTAPTPDSAPPTRAP